MDAIMAYLQGWRESVRRGVSGWGNAIGSRYAAALKLVATDCPLCQGPAQGGGLCRGCAADVVLSMRLAQARCSVCCLALGQYSACPDCAQQSPAYDRIIAAFDYEALGHLLIHRFKAERRFALARTLAEMLAAAVNGNTPALPRNTILVPVPASRASIQQRGFNPAAEIARYLARQLQLPYRPDLLIRSQEGVRQKQLTRTQRAQSTLQLYSCPVRVEQAAIAVVDDVLTTGSTLHGIAGQFKAAGAVSVCGLVLARTPYR
jgi:ComF family protein